MALSANTIIARKDGVIQAYPCKDNVHVYKGALVCVNTSGYACPAADTIGYRFVGIAMEECDNTLTGHTAGGKDVLVEGGRFLLTATSISQAMVGQMMYIVDDATVDDYSGCSNFIAVGKLDEYVSATSGWVNTLKRFQSAEEIQNENYADIPDSDSGRTIVAYAAASNNEYGICQYCEAHLTGVAAGHNYGFGSWVNIDDGATVASSRIVVPIECGVYEGAATISAARIIFGIQAQAILTDTPGSLYFARLNTTKTITAMFAGGNNGSLGYAASAGTSSTKCGDIPFADIAGGTGVVYIRLYNAAG